MGLNLETKKQEKKNTKAVAIKVQSIDFRKELLTCRAEKEEGKSFHKKGFQCHKAEQVSG